MKMTPKEQRLLDELEQLGFEAMISPPEANQTEPALFILNYRPAPGKPIADFALPIGCIQKGGLCFTTASCWISQKTVKPIDNNCPGYNPDYHERNFKGRLFHPFSVAITAIHCNSSEIEKLIASLYSHIVFDEQ